MASRSTINLPYQQLSQQPAFSPAHRAPASAKAKQQKHGFPRVFPGFARRRDCVVPRNVLTFAFFRQGYFRLVEQQS